MPDKSFQPGEPAGKGSGPDPETKWTVRRVLQWTTEYFQTAGLASPRLDAEVLLAHTLGRDRLGLYLGYDAVVADDHLKIYRQQILRRVGFEPVAYLTGVREFFSLPFRVNPSVLIPRPETEHLVEQALLYVKREFAAVGMETLRILDVGTGCGNLPIALSRSLPAAWFVGVDVSAQALEVARANREALAGPQSSIHWVQGDLLDWLQAHRARFHLILSNPPYVSERGWEQLAPEVRDREPRIALCAGERGTELQERILRRAGGLLLPRGALIMEIGETQAPDLLEAAVAAGLYETAKVFPDYGGRPRVLVARRPGPAEPAQTGGSAASDAS